MVRPEGTDARAAKRWFWFIGLIACGLFVVACLSRWRADRQAREKTPSSNLSAPEDSSAETGPPFRPQAQATTQPSDNTDAAEPGALLPRVVLPSGSAASPTAEIATLKEEALAVARQLIADLPGNPEALGVLALMQARFGKNSEATATWEACLDLNPRLADAYHGLGTIAMKRGQSKQAVGLLRKALLLNPGLPECRDALADALMRQAEPQEASVVLEEAVAAGATSAGTYFRLGEAYMYLKRYEKAKENFLLSVRMDPDGAYPSYHGLANACARLGQPDESKAYLEKFAQLKESLRKAESERLKSFDDAAAVRESVSFAHMAAGQIYGRHGDDRKARTHWLESARLNPRATIARQQLTMLYLKENRLPEASRMMEQLCEIQPANALYWLNLAKVNVQMQRLDAAEDAISRALELDPQNAESQRLRQSLQSRP